MISRETVYDGLAEIFSEVFMRNDIALSDGLKAVDVACLDSFKQIEVLIATEQRFGMKFSSAEMDRFTQLGDMVDIVVSRGHEV